MKMVLMYADAARINAVREDLAALGAPGYTVIPVVEGGGRTGIHTGDRVHPGALALVMVIDEDANAERLFDEMAKRRELHRDAVSRLFLMPAEGVAFGSRDVVADQIRDRLLVTHTVEGFLHRRDRTPIATSREGSSPITARLLEVVREVCATRPELSLVSGA